MGNYEDFWYEISILLEENELKEIFNKQLCKMENMEKYRYMEMRDRWRYAYDKVIKLSNKKVNI